MSEVEKLEKRCKDWPVERCVDAARIRKKTWLEIINDK